MKWFSELGMGERRVDELFCVVLDMKKWNKVL